MDVMMYYDMVTTCSAKLHRQPTCALVAAHVEIAITSTLLLLLEVGVALSCLFCFGGVGSKAAGRQMLFGTSLRWTLPTLKHLGRPIRGVASDSGCLHLLSTEVVAQHFWAKTAKRSEKKLDCGYLGHQFSSGC